jgi:hypothetical protein
MAQRPDLPVDGTTITSACGTTVREQIVTPFSNATDRAGEIPSSGTSARQPGMVSTLTASDATNGLYVFAGAAWRAPWNLPWGNVATSGLPSSFSFNASGGGSVNANYSATFTWTAVNNRNYLVTFGGEFNNGAVTGLMSTAAIYTNASPPVPVSYAGIRATFESASGISTNSQETRSTAFVYTATSSGTLTWKFGAIANTATTTQTFIPNLLSIVDIGPAGAPV